MQFNSGQLMTVRQILAFTLFLFSTGALSSVLAEVTFTPITEGSLVEEKSIITGVAWGDYDNDGYTDVVLTKDKNNLLYRNNGDGTFKRVEEGILVTDPISPSSPAWADQDNDGDLDLFIATLGVDVFYRNEGAGAFTKVTEGDWLNTSAGSGHSAWGDYDNDGFLDLYVTATESDESDENFLYHNNGDGTMEPVSTAANSVNGSSGPATWTDYDDDGDVDLLVGGQGRIQFRNDGEGVFTWITHANGGVQSLPDDHRDSGLASADYDNDGDLDVLYGNNLRRNAILYRNDGEAGLVPATPGLPSKAGDQSPDGYAFGDYDNDGYQDLFITNAWGTDSFLYHNEGDGRFTLITDSPVVGSGRPFDIGGPSTIGCSWVDYDNDGDLDLFVGNGRTLAESSELFRNDGGTNNWVTLNLVGTVSNRSAIGTKVWALATIDGKDINQLREINGGDSGRSKGDLRAHFGLGDATTVDTLRIEWPSGQTQVISSVAANQILQIRESVSLDFWAEERGIDTDLLLKDQNQNRIPELLDYLYGNQEAADRRQPRVEKTNKGLQIWVPAGIEAAEGALILEKSTSLKEPWSSVAIYNYSIGDSSGWSIIDNLDGRWLSFQALAESSSMFYRVRGSIP